MAGLFDVHSPYCDEPTGKTGRVRHQCSHGIIDRDAGVCGALKPCPRHGGDFPSERDVPQEVRRALMEASVGARIDYYWLCAVYRRGRTSLDAELRRFIAELEIALDLETHAGTDPAAWIDGVITKLKGLL